MPAKSDLVTDPEVKAGLLMARRGTAFFLRQLKELADDELAGPSLLPGWSRAHLVSHVGYNARALTRLTEWGRTGVEQAMYASLAQRNAEIDFGATLNPIALRNLAEHSAVHLDVEWRDLDDAAWQAPVRTIQGRVVPVAETTWMRSREVWVHAVDLANGARFEELPAPVLHGLLRDVTTAWRGREGAARVADLSLRPVDGAPAFDVHRGSDAMVLTGTSAALARWVTGRGNDGVATDDGSPVSAAPQWI